MGKQTMAQQTLAASQTYFTDKWLERKQYLATTARQSRFKEAALLAQETKAAKEEGESQEMLFAMLQEQHDKQIAVMTAANKANMDSMMERMNALVAEKAATSKQHQTSNPTRKTSHPRTLINPRNQGSRSTSASTAKHKSCTNQTTVLSSR